MKSWYSNSNDIEMKDGSKWKEYRVVFETDSKELKLRLEKRIWLERAFILREKSWRDLEILLSTVRQMEGQMMKDYTLTSWKESRRRKERL